MIWKRRSTVTRAARIGYACRTYGRTVSVISVRVYTRLFPSDGVSVNVTHNPQFAAPNGSVTSQSFGTVTAQANAPRSMHFGLKISF
jgi:hypothetical protein